MHGFADYRADLFVEPIGTLGQFAHLVGDHRKAPACLASTRCLDCCIQREQIGLVGDHLDVTEQPIGVSHVLDHIVDALDHRHAVGTGIDHIVDEIAQHLIGLFGKAGHGHAFVSVIAHQIDHAADHAKLPCRTIVQALERTLQGRCGIAYQPLNLTQVGTHLADHCGQVSLHVLHQLRNRVLHVARLFVRTVLILLRRLRSP